MEQIATVAPDVTPQFINSLTVFIGDKPVNVSKAARACNIAQPHLSRILSGQRTLTKTVERYLCSALDMDQTEIRHHIFTRRVSLDGKRKYGVWLPPMRFTPQFNQKSLVIPQ